MPFAATWMDMEIIRLSEVSQRKTNIIWYHFYVESRKKSHKWTYLQNRNRLTDLENKLMVMGGRVEGRDRLGVWDWHIQTTMFKITNKDLLYSTGNSAQYSQYISLNEKRIWKRIHGYVNWITLLYIRN